MPSSVTDYDSTLGDSPRVVQFPITPRDGTLKVVYSNHPALLRGLSYKVFPPKAHILWFPECELNGAGANETAMGRKYPGASIIVTNSALLLRAFQMYRYSHPKAVSFYYVQYHENEMGSCPGDFTIHATNNLEVQPCPQVDWDAAQASAYLSQR